MGSDGYPIYRRRNTGRTTQIRGHMLNNRWVVPYNAYLLAMFDCRINVEVCASIKAIKYLYKYIYKGHEPVEFNAKDIILATGNSSPSKKHRSQQQYQTPA